MVHITTLLTSGLLLLTTNLQAQSQDIKGTIVDTKNKAIEYATVLMQTQDSTYIGATITDSLGRFQIPNKLEKDKTRQSDFRLIVQHLLYDTFKKNYSYNQNNLLITLKEKSNTLKEITVKGYKPIAKAEGSKISYDLPSLLNGKVVNNAYEALLQLPGVTEKNEVLSLAGTSKINIIINGKISNMSYENLIALLKSYPSNKIKKAEIIYSTPPQYHVRGASINLVLQGYEGKKQLKGQFNTTYKQGFYDNYEAGASLFAASPKLTTDFNYSYSKNHAKGNVVDIYSHHILNNKLYEIVQHNNGTRKTDWHNLRLAMAYQPTKQNKWSLTYNTRISSLDHSLYQSYGTYSNSAYNKKECNPTQFHNILLDFTSTKGFSIGSEISTYHTHSSRHFQELEEDKLADFTTNDKQDIHSINIYADCTKKIKNDWSFNYGGKYAYSTDFNSQHYTTITGNDKSRDDSSSKLYETTADVYLGFKGNIGSKFSFETSLSGEYYQIADYKEWTLFPNLSATYKPSTNNVFQLSFSSDRVYPNYWDLQGATSYINSYAEVQGNPKLKPYKDYSTQLSYILKNRYVFTLYSNYQKDYFTQLPYQSPERLALIYNTLNFDYDYTGGLSISAPINIGNRFNSNLTIAAEYRKVKDAHYNDISFRKEKLHYYTTLNNTFHLLEHPNIYLELDGIAFTPELQGPNTISLPGKVDAGIKWTFSHNNGELQLKGNDIFNTWNPTMKARFSTQNYKMDYTFYQQSVLLSFTWRFNGYKTSHHKELNTSRFGTN